MGSLTTSTMTRWASAEDWEACRAMRRRFGTTYYFSTRFFPTATRPRIDALYAFVRVPDAWVNHPSPLRANVHTQLEDYRRQTVAGFRGVTPASPILRTFLDVARECNMTPTEPLLFLDAMASDLSVSRYPSYADLERYMRGSASSIGLMLCDILGVKRTGEITDGAMALSEAMQLTHFLRDVGEDLEHGRIYLPLEDMDRFGVTEEDLFNRRVSPEFIGLMEFEIKRARRLYGAAEKSIPHLPVRMQRSIRLACLLQSRILDRIEQGGYSVFHRRARTTSSEKLGAAMRVLVSR